MGENGSRAYGFNLPHLRNWKSGILPGGGKIIGNITPNITPPRPPPFLTHD